MSRPSSSYGTTSDEIQAEAAMTRNESPSAAIPIPGSPQSEPDEHSDDLAATLVNDRPSVFSPGRGWRAVASRSIAALSSDSRQSSPDDRSR